jgi:polyphosphate kinase
MNALLEPEIIAALYDASQAGVKIDLIVRGVCALRPGVAGVSENIRVRSVLGRFLEHSRIFYFFNGGAEDVYLSSADWMQRNLDRRVELMFPVVEQEAQQKVVETLETQFADNRKARQLRPDGSYERVAAGRSESLRAQEYLYRRTVREQERIRSVTPVRFTPIEAKD